MVYVGLGLMLVLTTVTCNKNEHKAQGMSVGPLMADGVVFLKLGSGECKRGGYHFFHDCGKKAEQH